MSTKTQGQLEAQFSREMIKFEKDHFGRGPLEARTFFLNDMILVRLRGILTPAETKLAQTSEGRTLVKETRRQLFEASRPELETIVQTVVQCQVTSLHTDMSTKTGERIVVLTIDTDLDKKYR